MWQGDQRRTWRNQGQRIEIIHQVYGNIKPGVQHEGLKLSLEPIAGSMREHLETQKHLADQLILAEYARVIVLLCLDQVSPIRSTPLPRRSQRLKRGKVWQSLGKARWSRQNSTACNDDQ